MTRTLTTKNRSSAARRCGPTTLWFLVVLLSICHASTTPTTTTTTTSITTTTTRHNKVNKNKKAGLDSAKSFVASGLAAICAKTALAPFDTLKTVQQHHRGTVGIVGDKLSLFQAARQVTSRGRGVLELYAGLGVAALGSVPSVGLYFGIYSYSKSVLSSSRGFENKPKWMTIAVSAALGNTVASFARVPFEVVKQRLQTQSSGTTISTLTTLRSMLREPKSLFPLGGVSSQMARDVPYAICTLLTYEYLRDVWVTSNTNSNSNNNHNNEQQSQSQPQPQPQASWRDGVAGAAAGGFGSWVTNPLDVIKTRMQTQTSSQGEYAGVLDCARQTYHNEGPTAFLKGSVPRLIHKVPANAIFFISYEFFKRLLRVEEGEDGDDGAD